MPMVCSIFHLFLFIRGFDVSLWFLFKATFPSKLTGGIFCQVVVLLTSFYNSLLFLLPICPHDSLFYQRSRFRGFLLVRMYVCVCHKPRFLQNPPLLQLTTQLPIHKVPQGDQAPLVARRHDGPRSVARVPRAAEPRHGPRWGSGLPVSSSVKHVNGFSQEFSA